ncbi:MAG: DUF5947 family protein, partial [Nocardioidaceae bacterium]
MSSAGGNGGGAASLAVLRSMKARKPPDPTVQRCDMCAEQINDEHQHVVDLHSRALMCTCRACYLLFVSTDAQIRYRAVPERYLSFPTLSLQASQWDTLQIP